MVDAVGVGSALVVGALDVVDGVLPTDSVEGWDVAGAEVGSTVDTLDVEEVDTGEVLADALVALFPVEIVDVGWVRTGTLVVPASVEVLGTEELESACEGADVETAVGTDVEPEVGSTVGTLDVPDVASDAVGEIVVDTGWVRTGTLVGPASPEVLVPVG